MERARCSVAKKIVSSDREASFKNRSAIIGKCIEFFVVKKFTARSFRFSECRRKEVRTEESDGGRRARNLTFLVRYNLES